MDSRLNQLFRCEKYGFLAHRHCMRRQVEHQAAQSTTSVRRTVGSPTCSESCPQGRTIREALAGLTARPCATCGTALIGLPDDAPCPACEERRQVLEVPRILSRRVPVSSRIWTEPADAPFVLSVGAQPRSRSTEAAPSIENTSEVVTAGQEPDPRAEEPMAEVAEAVDRPICSVCHETPLRSHNRSGVCTQCRRTTRVARRPALAARTVHGDGDTERYPAVADASDEYLVEAARELASRIDRIRTEAEVRLEKLNGALEVLRAAREVPPR